MQEISLDAINWKFAGVHEYACGSPHYESLEWHSKTPKPTLAEIRLIEVEYAEHVRKTAYQKEREKAYGSWQKQMEMQFDDAVNGTTTWVDHVAAVKQRFPKVV